MVHPNARNSTATSRIIRSGVKLADAIAEDHFGTALIGFGFCAFAAVWAWINFTWMASAFDTDDWLFRVITMVQMLGVCIMALGVEPFFTSIAEGHTPNNAGIVLGYVIMRVALLAQWVRVAASTPRYRRTAISYIVGILIAQIGWIITAVVPLSLTALIVVGPVLYVIELGGPVVAERKNPTPWNAHHIAERYGLLTIITIGEGVVGTVYALQTIVEEDGWIADIAVLGASAMVLNLALWWIYFSVPVAHALERNRAKSFPWGYGHIVMFMAIAAFGAGLHVVALAGAGKAEVGDLVVACSFIIPLALAVILIEVMDAFLTGYDGVRTASVVVTLALLGVGLVAVQAGASPLAALVWSAIALVVQIVVEEFSSRPRRAQRLKIGGKSVAS